MSTLTQAKELEQDLPEEICEYDVREMIGPGQSDSESRLRNSWNIFGRRLTGMRLNALFSLVLLGLFFLLPATASAKARFSSIKNPRSVAGAQGSDPITQNNWRRHPKIKTIRQVVESVNAGIRKSTFKSSKRVFEYCEPYEDTLRKIAVDSSGVVRRYEKQGGSEDSSLTWEHYYDSAGRLRFVFISGGAANGARLEHRIYFDESSQRIWESHKYRKGPEYSFPEVWPDDQLQKADPANAFKADSKCPETKGRQPPKLSSSSRR